MLFHYWLNAIFSSSFHFQLIPFGETFKRRKRFSVDMASIVISILREYYGQHPLQEHPMSNCYPLFQSIEDDAICVLPSCAIQMREANKQIELN